jgi:hypothetical protein
VSCFGVWQREAPVPSALRAGSPPRIRAAVSGDAVRFVTRLRASGCGRRRVGEWSQEQVRDVLVGGWSGVSLVRRQRHWSRVVDVHGWTPVHGPRADRGPEIVPGHQTPQ